MAPDQIERIFTYQAPTAGQPEKYVQLRSKAKELAVLINDLCPESREKSTAITNVQQAVMWANASIATADGQAQPAPEPKPAKTDPFTPDSLADMARFSGKP